MRRTLALGSAGALLAGVLAAGVLAVAPAAAGAPTGVRAVPPLPVAGSTASGGRPPGSAPTVAVPEQVGVLIAAGSARRRGVGWADCPAGWSLPAPVRCGWITVPVDYTHPFGATIRLAVDRAAATGTARQRQGALVYDPGGPGGSGLRFPLRSTTRAAPWTRAATAYDFVGFDPRGVGHSAPISCQDPREYAAAPKPDPVPDGESGRRAHRALARAYAGGCLARTGAGTLAQMTTPNTARDLDVIRAGLGERRLTYLGVSYGTYLGAVYATLFPAHVRRMIVDSVVNPAPGRIWYRDNLGQDAAFEVRWRDWESWVASHDSAYHLGATTPQVQARWRKLRAAAAEHPIGGTVGPSELLAFFQNAPYYDSDWTVVAEAWSRYAAGDTSALVDAAGPHPGDTAGNAAAENGAAVYTAVECADAAWPRKWSIWDRDNSALDARYPFLTWSNAWLNLPCATWPVPNRTPVDVRSRPGLPGVLIVQSARDAATPYAGALELHRRLAGSRMVTERDAGSHGVTGLVNRCVNSRVDAYLLDGVLDRHDVRCGPHAVPGPPTEPAPASEAVPTPTSAHPAPRAEPGAPLSPRSPRSAAPPPARSPSPRGPASGPAGPR